MTKKPKKKENEKTGKLERKGVKAKAGLNRAILNVGWHQLHTFTKYKAHRAGKVTKREFELKREAQLFSYTDM